MRRLLLVLGLWNVFPIALVMCLFVLAVQTAPAALGAGGADANMVQNGSFQRPGPRGVASGWSMSGPFVSAELDRAAGVGGRVSQKIQTAGQRALTFRQDVSVERGIELYFSAWVKSDDRLVARIGRRSMSYTEQGRWQKLVGLVRTGNNTKLRVSFVLGGLTGQANTLWISDVSLRKIQRPSTPQRKVFGRIWLATGDRPSAYIVYPSGMPGYRKLADQLRAAVAARTGVALKAVTDAEATEADRPVLKTTYRDSNLILLGRLGINRAMWTAYNRFLCAVDGYYPGGSGYVVRTASNVLRNGKNHLILGGSSEKGAARAVERFVKSMRQSSPTADGSFSLPWLLDVELGGECLAAFKADDELWGRDPWNALLLPKEPGYGTVRRWYHNAMAYYWSGWPTYRKRTVDYLEPILRDRARTHHYIVEFFIRTCDMLDDSGIFTPQQLAVVDDLILTNFWEFMTGPDLGWMTVFSPPYDSIRLVNRHSIAPWMADLKMADFLHDYFDVTGGLADLIEYRRTEKRRFMRHMVTERWGPSVPGTANTGHEEETTASLFRYALDHDIYEFFENGNARRALGLDKINHLNGWCVRPAGRIDHHLILGILANYYRDGRYSALLNTLPIEIHPTGHFMGRYVNGVRRYTPGRELTPRRPDASTGVRRPPLMPHNRQHLAKTARGRYQWTKLDPDDVLDFVAFRSGFQRDDDYVALTGIAGRCPPGVFLSFVSCGSHWLGTGSSGAFGAGSDRYFDQNAVHVLRTDRWLTEERPYAAAAKLDWVANLHRTGGVAFTLEPFMQTSWRRAVVWVQPRLFVVRDVVTALETGQFEVAVTWRPNGIPSWDGTTWTSVTDTGRLRITPLGRGFRVHQNVDDFRQHRTDELFFRQAASVRQGEGESVTATTVLQSFRKGDLVYEASLGRPDQLLLTPDGRAEGAIVVCWAPVDSDEIRSDGKVVIASPKRIQAMDATYVEVGGAKVLSADHRVSICVDCEKGRVAIDGGTAEVKREAQVMAADVAVTPGLQFVGLASGARRALRQTLERSAARRGLGLPARPAPAPETAARRPLEAVDRTAQWRRVWSYKGLMRPARVRSIKTVGDDIVDLGKVIELAEIRAVRTGRMWEPTRLPDDIRTALQSGDWRKLGERRQWRASVRTGNYGRADPVAEAFQSVRPQGLRARFVRAENAHDLIYYDANVQESRTPLQIEVTDMDKDGRPEILVAPIIWPPFVRRIQEEDCSMAVLRADGSEVFQYDAPTNVQSLRLLDYDRSGKKRIVMTTIDAQIRIFDAGGRLDKQFDLYEMHHRFNETSGRPNTRHPAGGYTMPYGLGLWRPGATGTHKIVVARYGAFSFIDDKGRFEGVLKLGSYVQPGMLPYGIDFNGDGVDEQLCLARGALLHLDGEATPTVRDPGGARFYPQVYAAKRVRAPTWDRRLNGGPILAFETLPWGADPTHYVLAIRDDYLGIYDGLEKKWVFTWVPIVSLRAAAIVQAGADTLRVLAITADDLLWELNWEGHLDTLAGFQTRLLPDRINRISASPGVGENILLAGEQGLYMLHGVDALALIASGSFRDVGLLPRGPVNGPSLVAVTKKGEVVRIDLGED